MPVISPRRSSTSASGSLYGTTSASSGGGSSSASASSTSASSSLHAYSPSAYLNRASSLSKTSPSTTGYSSYSTYASPSLYLSSSGAGATSSYTSPSTYLSRSSLGSHRSSLSGGSSATLGTSSYRTSSLYLGSSSNDSVSSSRYGYGSHRSNSTKDYPLKRDGSRDSTKKPPSGSERSGGQYGSSERRNSVSGKRLSGSSSSSSLARLVATSGAEMYEKYSPANYKTPCELARSRSEASDVAGGLDGDNANESAVSHRNTSASVTVTLERPRSRYSRLYQADEAVPSQNDSADTVDHTSASFRLSTSRAKLANSSSTASLLSNSSSCSDVPTATFTLPRPNRSLAKTKKAHATNGTDNNDGDNPEPRNETNGTVKRNGSLHDYRRSNSAANNGHDTTTTQQLRDLKLSTSASTSALNDGVSNAAATNGENGDGIENEMNGDVSGSVALKLDNGPGASNTQKIRSTTTGRSVLPPSSPTSSRYWDRDSSRTASSLSSSTTANNSDVDDVSKGSDGKHEGLCGLRNIGNTCFMNSVIQCLSHTTELTKFLRSHNGSRTSASKDQAILFEFAKLIREMWTNNVHSVTPMELKRAFSTKHRMYSDYNQQDAQEFLRFFLDSLHGALNSGIKGEVLKIDENLSDNKKAELTWEWYTRHENSLIRDLFVGQLKSTLRCTTCGNTSVTFDPFWDLSVSLPSSSRCKLEACLDLFIKEEVLDGDEMPTCSKCQTRRKCTKSFTIQRFPKYLVIHLKRFSETRWSKMSNIVEFPTGERELNMGPYGSNRSSMYYSLYAISNHMGSTAGGHYVALCKHPVSKKWHEFNDNIVSDSLSESQLVSSSAYILFYERV